MLYVQRNCIQVKISEELCTRKRTEISVVPFFHGVGERGSIYDNEYQLYHGGQVHMNKVDNGSYDGFLLYPQSVSGYFTGTQEQTLVELIQNVLVSQAQVDPFRVSVDGLSAGGAETWDCLMYYAKSFAAFLPISDAEYKYQPFIVQNKWSPIWLFQGALDNNPPPVRARILQSTAIQAGANLHIRNTRPGDMIVGIRLGRAELRCFYTQCL